MNVLVVNAGSSSLKLRVLDAADEVVASEDLPAPRGETDAAAVAEAIERFGPVDAVGHRIVHGGRQFLWPVVVDREVVDGIRALTDLAPLHQPKSLAVLEAVTSVLPSVPAVACFDTAFHADMPAAAATYALPPAWRARWDMRQVLSRAAAGDASATLGLDVYVHRVAGSAAAMTASLGGLDAIAFTGGVGENAPEVRRRVGERLAFLGVGVDEASNADGEGDRDITAAGSPVRTLVIEAREDLQIAHE